MPSLFCSKKNTARKPGRGFKGTLCSPGYDVRRDAVLIAARDARIRLDVALPGGGLGRQSDELGRQHWWG